MKQKLMIFLMLLFSGGLYAQHTVSGTITSAEDGTSLPGASVLVQGTTNGAISNADGQYAIVADNAQESLVFSFIGYTDQVIPINGRSTINVVLQPSSESLDEVVVTALGIKREQKSLGYSVSSVKGQDIVVAAPQSLGTSLYGKTAGLQIAQNSGGPTGGVKLSIRGITSLDASRNRPLIIMDGIPVYDNDSQYAGRNNIDRGSAISDLNPDDIASIEILKGASAAALYGSQAANGVIMITTKKGSTSKGLGVSFSSSYMVDNVVIYEQLQNEFGGQLDSVGGELAYIPTPWSFGPKMEGQEVRWWDGEMRSFSPQPDNMKDIYQTGYTAINSVSVQNSFEKGSYRLSYTRQDMKGTLEGTKQAKNTLSLGLNLKISDKLHLDASVNYYNIETNNPPLRTDRLIDWGFARSSKMDMLRDHTVNDKGYFSTPEFDGVTNTIRYNLNYPMFWMMTENQWNLNTDRLVGSFALNYQILNNLSFRVKAGTDYRNFNEVRKNAYVFEGNNDNGLYLNANTINRQDYFEGLFSYNANLNEDITLNINAGALMQQNSSHFMQAATNGGLVVEGWYSLANSEDQAKAWDRNSGSLLYAALGTAQFGYKDLFFVDVTGRNDWSSILPEDTRSYFYPSISSSFILSEATDLPEVISFAKLRASYAQVGNPGPLYKAVNAYSYSNFNGATINSISSAAPPLDLKSELQTSYEFGLDSRFLNNRIGLDLTYFWNSNKNQILNLGVAQSTGNSSLIVNAGELQNKGIEIQLDARAVETDDFSWDVIVNMSSVNNKVIELAEGIDRLKVGGGWGVDVFATVDRPYGEFWLKKWKRADGERVIDANGYYIQEDEASPFGTGPAKAFGGIINNLKYKNFDLNILVDYSLGGKLGTMTNVRGMGMGRLESSLPGRNEEHGGLPYYVNAAGDKVQLDNHDVAAPAESADGIVYHDGIIADGVQEVLDGTGQPTGEYSENNSILTAEEYYRGNFAGGFGFAIEEAIQDNNYFKVREIALGYTLSNDLVGKIGLQDLKFSLIGRNLFYLYKSIPNIDPESAMGTSSFAYLEHTPYPTTRSIGFSIKANF